MGRKSKVVLPLATALASLAGTPAVTDQAVAKAPETTGPATQDANAVRTGSPNLVFKAGDELLGLVVSEQADGTVLAQHYSHSSHASHASHASHYSGR